MKIKDLLFLIPMLVMTLSFVSCGEDENEKFGETNEENTEIKGDYTATTSVKTTKLTNEYPNKTYELAGIKIYEDYNHLYSLSLNSGKLLFIHYKRDSGYWKSEVSNSHGIKDKGKVSSLIEITAKDNDNDGTFSDKYYDYLQYKYSTIQPKHGYAAFFTTENDEVKYMRIFVKDYSLNQDDGSLESITIQYQLY